MIRLKSFQGANPVRYLWLAIFTAIVLLPFYWLLKSAVSTPEQLFALPPVHLPTPTLSNFNALVEQVPFYRYLLNSLIFATATSIVSVVVGFLAAYAFARITFPGSEFLLWLLLLSMSLPEIATVIPLYQILSKLSLLDSLAGLTLVMGSVLVPFSVWMLIAFIKQVPYEIEEAARIDGASLPRILWKIVVPVTWPALATMGIINFVNAWNNLLYPLAFSVTPRSKTLSVAITEIFVAQTPWGKPWNLVSALGVAMVIPVIILVIFANKAIVQGLTRGAVK